MSDEKSNIDAGAAETQGKGPWGFWATLGFFVIILIVLSVVGLIVGIAYGVATAILGNAQDTASILESFESNGFIGCINSLLSVITVLPMTFLLVWARKGPGIREYLGLKRVPARQISSWIVRGLLLVAVADALTSYLGRPIVNDFMVNYYSSAPLIIVLIPIVVVAPVLEEVLFRGFFFTGFRHSVIGVHGAVMMTSLLWALMHYQYDLYEIGITFGFGILLGYARSFTGSVYTTMAVHMINNVVSTIEATFFVSGL